MLKPLYHLDLPCFPDHSHLLHMNAFVLDLRRQQQLDGPSRYGSLIKKEYARSK